MRSRSPSRPIAALCGTLLLPVAQLALVPTASAAGLVDPLSASKPGVDRPGYELVFSDEFSGNRLDAGALERSAALGRRLERRALRVPAHQRRAPVLRQPAQRRPRDARRRRADLRPVRVRRRAARDPRGHATPSRTRRAARATARSTRWRPSSTSCPGRCRPTTSSPEVRLLRGADQDPAHDGTFPAFWLYHQRSRAEGTQRTEIDIMENLGHAPQYIYNSAHYNTGVAVGRERHAQVPEARAVRPGLHRHRLLGRLPRLRGRLGARQGHLADRRPGRQRALRSRDGSRGALPDHQPRDGRQLDELPGLRGRSRPTRAMQHFPNGEDLATFANPALEIDYVRVYARR